MNKSPKQICLEEGHRYWNVPTPLGNSIVCRVCGNIKEGNDSLQVLPRGIKKTWRKYG